MPTERMQKPKEIRKRLAMCREERDSQIVPEEIRRIRHIYVLALEWVLDDTKPWLHIGWRPDQAPATDDFPDYIDDTAEDPS